MFRLYCSLAFIVVSISNVNSWDIAITAGDQLELYTNGTRIEKEGLRLTELTALAYDAVHNMLLFVDKQNDNASIFSYNLAKKTFHPLVRRKVSENIQGLAFDPVKSLLFWTDSNERSIMWTSLLPDSKSNSYGSLLIRTDKEIPRAIVADSCRGYIYWTNIYTQNATIERMRFDGKDRKIIVTDNLFMPTSIALDQRERKLYWSDDKQGIHYSIESSDLEGNNRRTLYAGINHVPNAVSVSKDFIYWTDWGYKSVWRLPKNATGDVDPIEMISFPDSPYGIVATYKIEDQIEGVPECEELAKLSQNKTVLNYTFKTVKRNEGLFCLHGEKIEGKWACNCTAGYTGERCEESVCQNYCLNGDCSVTKEGHPTCKCTNGFEGSRCEVNMCTGYCLNNGACEINASDLRPTCKCLADYEGKRCESSKIKPTQLLPNDICNCGERKKENETSYIVKTKHTDTLETSDGLYLDENDCSSWDPLRDPIIMVLGVLSGLLCVVCAVLVTKIMHLRRRPRIKKRIIVNKNVTPLTARPDQCEITIENCCNMNICETPCFEPRTIKPTLVDLKPGKEEKKNLIANMEHNDDLY